MAKPQLVCLTPIKNEDWILDRFLSTASLWADHIIIADQYSTDKSVAICRRYSKVKLIRNRNRKFNEPERQKLLLDEARKIPGPKILLALDADEFLTPECIQPKIWQPIIHLSPGTVIWFDWLNVTPGFKKYWLAPRKMPFGFVDDGSIHQGNLIHSPRIPLTSTAKNYFPDSLKVLHFQYTDWQRMNSKHRWYQAYEETVNHQHDPVSLYRTYHHMYSSHHLVTLPPHYLKKYHELGIDLAVSLQNNTYWWDQELKKILASHQPSTFAWLDIWQNEFKSMDPRKWYHMLLHLYLRYTQPFTYLLPINLFDRLLIKTFKLSAQHHISHQG